MAKKDADLFDRLRQVGLRKQAAKALSGVSGNAGKKAQRVARAAVADLRAVDEELRAAARHDRVADREGIALDVAPAHVTRAQPGELHLVLHRLREQDRRVLLVEKRAGPALGREPPLRLGTTAGYGSKPTA